jgi:hypothetical protein
MITVNTNGIKTQNSGSGYFVIESNGNSLINFVSSSVVDSRSSINEVTTYFGNLVLKSGVCASGSNSNAQIDEKFIVSGSVRAVLSNDGSFTLGSVSGSGSGSLVTNDLTVKNIIVKKGSGGDNITGTDTITAFGYQTVTTTACAVSSSILTTPTSILTGSLYVNNVTGGSFRVNSTAGVSDSGVTFNWLLVN